MPRFLSGVRRFQTEIFPEKQALFEKLATGQSPEALFITCSDSRIETAMITQTDPGELFICRNAGNIVPPHTNHTGAMTASIEFAVAALKVPHIVVCGHTECGAMKGALNPEGLEALPHIKEWLGYSRAAVEVVRQAGDLSEDARMKLMLEQNVILQLQHLRTHPAVVAAEARGEVELHGWVYDIRSGGVTAYDAQTKSFLPIETRYASELASMATDCDHS
ncbi:carbonic anhydrase [Maricaulis sp. D1M11]|uniref:carbonic anhydrase n=1 Tax=Maricaulis sp. D1M11 TaxID=3076117 RepID=UPI0039B443BC